MDGPDKRDLPSRLLVGDPFDDRQPLLRESRKLSVTMPTTRVQSEARLFEKREY